MENIIEFDKKKFDELKMAYNKAKVNDLESFKFEGTELITAYAKYLIQYLDSKFKTNE
jgi:hypothetical protein